MPQSEMMEERLRLLEIDRDTMSNLRKARDILEPEMDKMLDRFYSHIGNEPVLQAFFIDEKSTRRARSAQKSHWLTLLAGKFDREYFERTIEIGRAHSRIGLTPDVYLSGYYYMFGHFIELIIEKSSSETEPVTPIIQALSKAVFLDMDLVISCYLDDKDSTMRNILQRATDFRSDIWKFSDNLNALATRIKAIVEAFSTKSGTRLEQAGDVGKCGEALLEPVEQLNQQTTQLDECLKGLLLSDKIYVEDQTTKSRIFSRLVALVSKKA